MKGILQLITVKLCVCFAFISQKLETKHIALKSGFYKCIIYRSVFQKVMLIKL